MLALCSPLMLAIYLLIPRDSPGKAIYRQPRRGLQGATFNILKFRTMANNAEEGSGPVFARRNDARVTQLGKLLRSTRLDELPQLINVLRGEMSLVGPRPERECFARKFDEELLDYPARTFVKPGLTGIAQVYGSYSTSAEDKLRLDLWYIANQSLCLDLQLLLHTGRVILQREKAAGIDANQRPGGSFASSRSIRHAVPNQGFHAVKPVFLRNKP
jgi:lipopolysaccharide/colanic/teichoic acid biosynthesis glycosyltransferase